MRFARLTQSLCRRRGHAGADEQRQAAGGSAGAEYEEGLGGHPQPERDLNLPAHKVCCGVLC